MKKILVLSLITVLVTLFIGCRSNSQNKIVGTWKFIPYTKPDSVIVNEWYFYAGDLLEMAEIGGTDSVIKRYSYTLDGSTLNIYGDTAELGPYNPHLTTEYRGKYWVDELNKEYLKCVKTDHADGVEGNAYLRIELVKL